MSRTRRAPVGRDAQESALLGAVLELAARTHWPLRYHTYDSRRSRAGFPDLVLARHDRLIFAELKSAAGIVTGAQQAWLDGLTRVRHLDSYVWRPADLQQMIPEVLR